MSRSTLLTRRSLLKAGGAALASGLVLPAFSRSALANDTQTVRLGWGPGGIPPIARRRGELEKRLLAQGIKVQWVGPFPNHAPSMQAIVGGSADFSFWGSTTPALAAMLAGSPLVFASFNVYSPRSTQIIVKKNSGIDQVSDLVGKRIAVNKAGLGEFLVVAALEKHNIDLKDVQFVYLNPPDAGPAFASNKVDAWAMWSPGVEISLIANDAKSLFFEGKDLDFLIDYSSLVVARDFAEKQPALVRAVLDAYYEEGKWISEHPEEAEELARQENGYSEAVRDLLISYRRQNRFYEAGDQNFMADFQRAADWLAERKIIKAPIKVSDYSVRF
ncbi:aliphatic sulfonate ABC transporter substrate-binding protein [Alcaligenes sp. 13f]|uniref:ABC transporter substrate-binding protein n=1 Tax=Alcaligenes sp. 13f TaxID=2841924 RepID=UPI001CF69CA8|nr:aliphatic sulfonate ABC transporter substrate-binding protein [Alcaligenes sp. 13f]MCB4320727.1 aliphatic sulfonate ABC transporter substrate-binding protein [Alcaligenes sp. 13f]